MSSRCLLVTISIVTRALACSYLPPSGVAITAAGLHEEDGRLRLELTAFHEGNVERTAQALLDWASGALTRVDAPQVISPTVPNFVSQAPATLPSVLPFNMTTAVVVATWSGVALGRVFVLYSENGGFDLQLAICDADGACASSPAPDGIGPLETAGEALVWDEQNLIRLRRMCCMCASHVYVKYDATTIAPLYNRDEGYQLGGEAVWQPSNHYVYVADATATGVGSDQGPLAVRRYSYAAAPETVTLNLPPDMLEAMFPSCGAGCIGGIAGGAAALLLLVLGVGCLVQRRRRRANEAQPGATFVGADHVLEVGGKAAA